MKSVNEEREPNQEMEVGEGFEEGELRGMEMPEVRGEEVRVEEERMVEVREEEVRGEESREEEEEEVGGKEVGKEREGEEERIEEREDRQRAPETDARRLVVDIGEGGSNVQRRKREYEEELEKDQWECKKRKTENNWVEAVFNDHQLIQVRYMQMMSRLVAEEDKEEFLGLVVALKESWEEAEEKIKQGEYKED